MVAETDGNHSMGYPYIPLAMYSPELVYYIQSARFVQSCDSVAIWGDVQSVFLAATER